MSAEDPGTFRIVIDGLFTLLITVGGALWTATSRRLDRTEIKMDGKADKEDVDRHSADMNALWTEMRSMRRDMSDQHVTLLNAINAKQS